jgi:hypothetical protein
MFYNSKDNTYIQEGQAFTVDGNQYPANYLNLSTPEEKAAIGLEEVIATNLPANDQYYWVSSTLDKATLTYTNTPKDLAQVKINAVSQINSTAYSLLLPSDWMAVKAFETSTPIDPAWNTWRATIRTEAANAITAINTSTNVDGVANAVNVNWTPNPNAPQKEVVNEQL